MPISFEAPAIHDVRSITARAMDAHSGVRAFTCLKLTFLDATGNEAELKAFFEAEGRDAAHAIAAALNALHRQIAEAA